MVHLLVHWLVDHWPVPQSARCILDIRLVEERQGVLHPVHIVAVGEVLLSMGSTGFLPSLCGIHLLHCLVEQILQLERLDEVRVPDHASVADTNILVLFHDLTNDILP